MAHSEPRDHITAFIEELLSAGWWLMDTAAGLADVLPPDAYPGEEPGQVVIEMIAGTIRTCLLEHDDHDVEVATGLIAAAKDRVMEHLQLALALSRRMHGEGGAESRRAYG